MRVTGLLILTATIAAEDLVELRAVPLRVRTSAEAVELDSGERMTLTGLHLDVLDSTPIPGLYGGLGIYGVIGGDFGGLFNWGASAGWRTPAWHGLRLDANGYAGGGGGAGAPVGEGLLLRAHLLATLTVGTWEFAGGLASSHFPSGEIGSADFGDTALTFGLHHLATGTLAAPWDGGATGSGILTTERWTIAPLAMAYFTGGDNQRRSGVPLADRIGLIGISFEHALDDSWWSTFTMATPVEGGIAGYMEVLGGVAWRPLLTDGLHLDARLLGGLGGGGDVDTGSGIMGRSELGLSLGLSRTLSLSARGGYMIADGDFDAASVMGELRWSVDHLALDGGSTQATLPAAATHLDRWSISVGDARYRVRSPEDGDIHLVSIALERSLSSYFSLVGCTRSALAGDGGGYSEGLFGARLGGTWSRLTIAAQGMVGAGGGGGLTTGNGAIGDLQLTGRLRFTDTLALHVGGGRVEAFDGDFSADVIEAGLVWSFAVAQ